MRVLVVTIVHRPDDARIRHRQIRALIEAGHNVAYIAPFEAFGVAETDGVRAVNVPHAAGRRRLRAVVAARRLIARHARDADIVILHDPELLVSVGGLRRLPAVVWDVHEDTSAAVSMKQWLPAPLRRPARRAMITAERWAERRYHLLLAEVSYQSRFRRSHPVVPNTTWVPDDVAPPGTDRIVYIGHLTRARGVDEMIEVGRLLPGNVRLELIGSADGASRPALQRAHDQGELVWHGFVPNDEALQRVSGALAGLSLLRDEQNYQHSWPTKVLEYMARGVPVITTPLTAARTLVERHQSGIVVPFDDPAAVAAAVRRLRDEPDLRNEFGRNGHDAALKHYSWPANAPSFVAQLETWAHEAAPRRMRETR